VSTQNADLEPSTNGQADRLEPSARRFRKKPVEVEAMHWDGTAEGATPIINWAVSLGERAIRYREADTSYEPTVPPCLKVDTLEGTMQAAPGDWIIRGVQGEFYPCKPDIFEATYDEIPCRYCAGSGWTGNRQTGPGMRHYHCPCGRPCRACGGE
jgi:hypothetical protein